MGTPAQLDFIKGLWAEYLDGEEKPGSLDKWILNSFGVSHIRFLDSKTTGKAITALKRMTRRKHEEIDRRKTG